MDMLRRLLDKHLMTLLSKTNVLTLVRCDNISRKFICTPIQSSLIYSI